MSNFKRHVSAHVKSTSRRLPKECLCGKTFEDQIEYVAHISACKDCLESQASDAEEEATPKMAKTGMGDAHSSAATVTPPTPNSAGIGPLYKGPSAEMDNILNHKLFNPQPGMSAQLAFNDYLHFATGSPALGRAQHPNDQKVEALAALVLKLTARLERLEHWQSRFCQVVREA